jgi:hypothetical protein
VALTTRRPAGTLSSTNRPALSVSALRPVPSANTAAPPSGPPRRLSTTVPRTTPSGAGACARAAAAAHGIAAAPTAQTAQAARRIRWRAGADTRRGTRAAGCEA